MVDTTEVDQRRLKWLCVATCCKVYNPQSTSTESVPSSFRPTMNPMLPESCDASGTTHGDELVPDQVNSLEKASDVPSFASIVALSSAIAL